MLMFPKEKAGHRKIKSRNARVGMSPSHLRRITAAGRTALSEIGKSRPKP